VSYKAAGGQFMTHKTASVLALQSMVSKIQPGRVENMARSIDTTRYDMSIGIEIEP